MSHRALTALALGGVLIAGAGVTFAAFQSTTGNPGNSFSADADWTAPQVSASVIARSGATYAGYLKQGGSYYVYANITDSGNPASGTASATANVSSIDAGQTAVTLTAGSYTVDGVTYNFRGALLTADATIAEGSYSYSITTNDNDSNSGTQGGFSVTVDNTAPSASDVQTANGSTIVGRAQQNDTITFSFSEPIEPTSLLAGWDGTGAQNVVVRLNNQNPVDRVEIWNSADTAQLAFGEVRLPDKNYVSATRTFGASGTASSMTMSGSTVTVVLGTASGGTGTGGSGTMTWNPSASAEDRAANAMSTASGSETGAADPEF